MLWQLWRSGVSGQVSAISSQVSAISGRCHVTAERSSLRILKFMVFSLLLYSPDLELIASDLNFICFLSFGIWFFPSGLSLVGSGLFRSGLTLLRRVPTASPILKSMVFSLLLYSSDLELIASDLSIYLVPAAFPPLSYIN